MTPVTFDPNGIYARARATCNRQGAAFEVYRPKPGWLSKTGAFLGSLIGGASFLFIAFGLIAMVGS